MTTADFAHLMRLVAENYPCTESDYPSLHGMSPEDRAAFVLRHNALHFAKSAGAVATLSEKVDHGAPLNMSEVQPLVIKALVNAIKLGEVAGMTAEQIVAQTEAFFGIMASSMKEVAA